jgi:hypothetical protein
MMYDRLAIGNYHLLYAALLSTCISEEKVRQV